MAPAAEAPPAAVPTPSVTPAVPSARAAAPATSATRPPAPAARSARVRVVVLDPGHDGGNGTYGPADDRVVTYSGFILIFGIPVLILLLTLLQNALEKRKDRRLAAAKARRARADLRGGW